MPVALLLAALLLVLPATAQAQRYLVRVMGQESLPPKWLLHRGRPQGLCPDILAAMEKAEPQLDFTGQDDFRSLPQIEQGLESGALGAACALLDSERRRKVAFMSSKLYTVRHRLAAAASDKTSVDSIDELVRLRPLITTSRGAAYSDQLRMLGLDVDDSTSDNLTNLKKILAGHGRFVYMNELTLAWIIREHKLGDKVRLLPAVLKEEPTFFWISKKADPEAMRLMNAALQKLRASGELTRIYERWANQASAPLAQ